MILTWIAPIPSWASLQLMAQSLTAAPAYEQRKAAELLAAIHAGSAHAFSFKTSWWSVGLIVLEPRDGADGTRRLHIEHSLASIPSGKLSALVTDLRKIAAEWKCDAVETMCYDPGWLVLYKELEVASRAFAWCWAWSRIMGLRKLPAETDAVADRCSSDVHASGSDRCGLASHQRSGRPERLATISGSVHRYSGAETTAGIADAYRASAGVAGEMGTFA